MAITFNSTNISAISFNNTDISTVTFNGTTVFTKYVTYTFPNSNVKMSAASQYGFYADCDARNSANQDDFYAFDNNLDTAYVGYVTSTQTAGKLYLTFPYKVLIQSITVKNRGYATSGDILGGIRTGTIKCSTAGNGTYDITYATINRGSDAETRSAATTYTNANYNNTAVKQISVQGTSWGDGTSSWHVIGEVSITFKVLASDLAAWKTQYNIA